jgi:hypothetical protein
MLSLGLSEPCDSLGTMNQKPAKQSSEVLTRPRIRAELVEILREQIGFLEVSCNAFDAEFEAEGKRIAATLRLLLHDTDRSISLLTLLGVKHGMKYVDTVEKTNPKNLLITTNYLLYRVTPTGGKYKPILGDGPMGLNLKPRYFNNWWGIEVHKENEISWCRKDFILTLANKEGGSHVDPEVLLEYDRVKNGGNQVFMREERNVDEASELASIALKPFPGNMALVGARQVAFEVLETLKNNWGEIIT